MAHSLGPHRGSRWLKRLCLVSATGVCIVALLAVGRWHLARNKVAQIAAAVVPSPVDSRPQMAPAAATVANQRGSAALGQTDAAARAAMHLHAVQRYRQREADDLAALPPPFVPATTQSIAQLKAMADTGNARAACVLGAQIAKCSYFPSMLRFGVKQLEGRIAAEREASATRRAQLAASFAQATKTQQQLMDECANAPAVSDQSAWGFMLQSALLGYQPAMEQFASFPPIDVTEPGAALDALVAWAEYAGPFTEAMAQRGDLNAITRAMFAYSGRGAILGIGLQELPRNPERAWLYAYLREAVMRRWEDAAPGSSRVWGNPVAQQLEKDVPVTVEGRAWARQMAEQMLLTFEPSAFQSPAHRESLHRLSEPWHLMEETCRY